MTRAFHLYPNRHVVARGFSLIEIAVVLVILAVLLASLGVPLSAQIEQRRRDETLRQLANIKESIEGFVLAKGRLPCPARPTDKGIESLISDETTGQCAIFSGLLPAVTLGVGPVDDEGFAMDAWGGATNRIRYAVTNINVPASADCPNATALPFTKRSGMRQAGMTCLSGYNIDTPTIPPPKTLLTVCNSTPTATNPFCAASKLTISAPFVVISLGKNGPTSGQIRTDEAWNSGRVGDGTVFVSRTSSGVGAPGGEFDDLVVWGSLNTLFARLTQAGQLP
jgi:prepilin-type N-terminal cleavage/methylation domain-containing protein